MLPGVDMTWEIHDHLSYVFIPNSRIPINESQQINQISVESKFSVGFPPTRLIQALS